MLRQSLNLFRAEMSSNSSCSVEPISPLRFSSSCIFLTWTISLFGGLWIIVILNLQFLRNNRFGITNFSCSGWKGHHFGSTTSGCLFFFRVSVNLERPAILQSQWKLEECCQLKWICQTIKEISTRFQINTNFCSFQISLVFFNTVLQNTLACLHLK